MARAALDWTIGDLSAVAGVGATTIVRFERGQSAANRSTLAAIERALEAAGVTLSNGSESAVQLSLHLSTPVEVGDDYIFSCSYKGNRCKVAVNKRFLDEFDLRQDAHQPRGRYLLKRLAMRVGAAVMTVLDRGRQPIGETVRLLADDLSPTLPEAHGKRLRVGELPTHDIPWDGSISLHREDIYGDDGR
jgi:transcriptional regulator with XRE-family HTH domain